MAACKHGYTKKIQFLIDYCQWFIDLTLCGWNRTEKQYAYASDLARKHNELFDEYGTWVFQNDNVSRVGDKLLEWISRMEVEYQDYGMKISFNFNFFPYKLNKLVINIVC